MRHLLPYKYIEEIAKAGSIRKAAETLAITPSALNRRLLTIEDELGVSIFERMAVGVRLNTAGEILLEHIRTQMSDLERVKSQIADLSGQRRGNVSIACSPELMSGYLPMQVYAYQSEFPGVQFKVDLTFREEVEGALSDHSSDVAFVFNPTKLVDFQSALTVKQTLYCVMKSDHPLSKKKNLRLYECAEFPLLLQNQNWGIRQILNQSALRLGINLRPSLQSDSLQFLNNRERAPDQLSFDLEINLENNNQYGDYVCVSLNEMDVPAGQLLVGQLKGRTLSVAAARFLEQLTTQMVSRFEVID